MTRARLAADASALPTSVLVGMQLLLGPVVRADDDQETVSERFTTDAVTDVVQGVVRVQAEITITRWTT